MTRWLKRNSAETAVRLLAVAVALLGLLNLWSALLARGPGRQHFLRETAHMPLIVEHASRLLIVLFGLALLMLARSLLRRKRQAWRIAVALASVAPLLHIAKGLDWEEAAVSLALLLVLMAYRHAFWAANDRPSARQGALAALALFAFAAVYGPVGFVLLRREFRPRDRAAAALPLSARVVRQTAHLLVYRPERPSLVARTHRAMWFEDSILFISLSALGYGTFMLLRPVLPRGDAPDADRRDARALLETWGGPPLAYFALLPDKRYLLGPDWGIAYVVQNRVAVALGDPLGDPCAAARAVEAFLALCRSHDWLPAFYQVTPAHLGVYRAARLKAIAVGEDAILNLSSWSLKGKAFQDFRTAINKMAKIGVAFEEVRDKSDPATLTQLATISDHWLAGQHGEEKTFGLGQFDPDGALFRDSRFFVARDTERDDRILAFVSFVPIFGAGWGLDLMRRGPETPNGLMEFLIARAALRFQEEGATIVSLGLSPLADSNPDDIDPAEDPLVTRGRELIFERFNHFYSFKGLHAFKEKFAPCWEPRYLICPGNPNLASVILAVLRAHSPRAGLRSFLRRVG